MIDDGPSEGNSDPTRMKRWRDAGRCVLPVHSSGERRAKLPKTTTWKQYQSRLPSDGELQFWTQFYTKDVPFGCVCGRISGGLEIIDFDHDAHLIFPQWSALVADILDPIAVVKTLSGFHVWTLCDEISGNHVLAKTADGKVRIETRGEGGFVVCPHPSSARHQLSGDWLPSVHRVTPSQRVKLWTAARQFNLGKSREEELREQAAKKLRSQQPRPPQSEGEITPWKDFNARMPADRLLSDMGWIFRGARRWARPGKNDGGHSATVCQASDGNEVIELFSSSLGIDPGTYSKFEFWRALKFKGDNKEAIREARKRGFGNYGKNTLMEFKQCQPR